MGNNPISGIDPNGETVVGDVFKGIGNLLRGDKWGGHYLCSTWKDCPSCKDG